MKTANNKYDVLVLGAGIAGLSYALTLAESRKDISIAIVAKSNPEACNTYLAQGGISSVAAFSGDTFESHIVDTLQAGQNACDEDIVRATVFSAPQALADLMRWGVEFDMSKNELPDLHREGGHSAPRIWHVKDYTGKEIESKLVAKAKACTNIIWMNGCIGVDILLNTEKDTCIGLKVYNAADNLMKDLYAKTTMLAGGACGAVFAYTTNPASATGDAVAMAKRAGLRIRNMQYMQFHPTALYLPKMQSTLPLLTEALRGEGAHILNHEMKRFLFYCDSRGELATRDIVSACIQKEMQDSGKDYVYLDCRHITDVAQQFPSVTQALHAYGYNIANDVLPIVPAAHYQCGGIAVDWYGKTSIKNLYSSGECSNTGLHGKNRLASNSLLEALVFSRNAAGDTLEHIDELPTTNFAVQEVIYTDSIDDSQEAVLLNIQTSLRKAMSMYCGIGRSKDQLLALKTVLHSLRTEFETGFGESIFSPISIETRNMLDVAALIAEHAMNHDENHALLSIV